MNERIKELVELATYDIKDEFGFWIGSELDKEKFAELIIEECLHQCYYRGMNDEPYEGQLKAASYIEEHFGIEVEFTCAKKIAASWDDESWDTHEWVQLTLDDIDDLGVSKDWLAGARWAANKLKEKNT